MAEKKESFAVIGCGRFGTNLALTLASLGHEVLCVDSDEDKINDLANYVTYAVQANVSQEGALDGIGLSNVDCAVVGLGSDFEASIMATSICKEKKIPRIVAKARNERHARILRKVGATKVVLPEKEMGIRLAHAMSKRSIFDYIELSQDYSIAEISIPESWVGKKIIDLDIRQAYHVSILGISNADFITINPKPEDAFREGDHIFVIGENEAIVELDQME